MAIKSTGQITILDVTDAYSVMLTSEAYTFVGGINGTDTNLTCTTQAVAYCGTNRCTNVSVDSTKISCPTGISATVSGNGSNAVTVTFKTTAAIKEACEATIPVYVDGVTVNKKFSFAVALKGNTGATGAAGVSITGVKNMYLASSATSGVKTSDAGWTDTMQTTDTTKKYLWSYQVISYSSGSPTNTVPTIIGTHGATGGQGVQGVSITGVKNMYLASSATSGVKTSDAGWTDTMQTTDTTKKYLWSYQVISYSSGSPTNTVPTIIGTHGATGAKGDTGAAGADAITLTITSSNGTIFKNNNGSTVLTAHVYKGAVEQTISDEGVVSGLGTVKWYVGSSTTGTAKKTITVSAADVTNSAVYTCQLEA